MSSARVAMLLAAVAILAVASEARAWGLVGHRSSAMVAEARLTPAARTAVRDLLDPGETLADASRWADDHRRDFRESAPWHYVNVPLAETHYDARFCPAVGCIVAKIVELKAVLAARTAPRDARQQALRLLVHFVQDLHQPLHVGDRGDRGGNDLQLRFFGRGTNLHRLWDEGIVDHHGTDETVWAAELEALASAPSASSWPSGRVESWADESLAAARKAYTLPGSSAPLQSGTAIGQAYFDEALPEVKRRLAKSAVRLASVLNEVFAGRTDSLAR